MKLFVVVTVNYMFKNLSTAGSCQMPDLLFKHFAIYLLTADLFKLFEPLIGKKSIQYANGPEGRKRRQLMDRSFSHEAVKDYYEHFVKVDALAGIISAAYEVLWGWENSHLNTGMLFALTNGYKSQILVSLWVCRMFKATIFSSQSIFRCTLLGFK